ncbi:transposase family protein [Streptomyces sp. NPDC056390]|uniref:transposase family protein n=1 Tax=Streptomyces sp. NPDC056390 TaxID=3345806 RepID=UPI0035DF94BD
MPSSLIDVLQRHREDADLLHVSAELAALSKVLDQLPDPRRVRGRRYRLGLLLALCLLAVLGGATTLASIARYAIDAPPEARARIGLHRPPRTTTLGRLLSRLGSDALDDAVGAWLARHTSDQADEGAAELECFSYDVLGELVHAWTSSTTPAGDGTGCQSTGGTKWGYRTDAGTSSGPVADARRCRGR